jgi:hypothetical protein
VAGCVTSEDGGQVEMHDIPSRARLRAQRPSAASYSRYSPGPGREAPAPRSPRRCRRRREGPLQVRTSPRWNLSIQPRYASVRIPAQYLATVPDPSATEAFGARYVFAPLHYTELNTSIRLNVALRPRLTLEVFAQPLIAGLDFHDPTTLAAPRTFDFEPYDGPIPSLDHTLRSLRGNALLRWEWRPGSTVYLAWQQTRLGAGETGQFSLRTTRGRSSRPARTTSSS